MDLASHLLIVTSATAPVAPYGCRVSDPLPEWPARRAVDEVAPVAVVPHHDAGTVALRDLLDGWWADDPAGPPTDEERASARMELGIGHDPALEPST
jgi:hypothetical protein